MMNGEAIKKQSLPGRQALLEKKENGWFSGGLGGQFVPGSTYSDRPSASGNE
jgi:hypothetical protein